MGPIRRAKVRKFVSLNNLNLVGLLETKVPDSLFDSISSSLLTGWNWVANHEYSPTGRGRIWVGWNPEFVTFEAYSINAQAIHGHMRSLLSGLSCCILVVYGEHTFIRRRPLWDDLVHMNNIMQDSAWLVAGDFNAIKDPSDRVGGASNWIPCFDEFRLCLEQTELEDLRYVGLRYTWSTFSGVGRKMRKIDRVLVNGKWNHVFSFSEASFLNSGIFDHSPMVVRILNPVFRKKPFKFFEFWMMHPAFTSIVRQVWESPVVGHPMLILMCKLKMLKWRLKELNREAYSYISERIAAAREALRVTQLGLQQDPGNITLAELEKSHRRQFVELRTQVESFYKQKSRVRWLQQGDRNTKFFHHSVKRRQLKNKILLVKDSTDSLISDPTLVPLFLFPISATS